MQSVVETRVKRNINNNVVDAVDRKWSPEVHTRIYIRPINVTAAGMLNAEGRRREIRR